MRLFAITVPMLVACVAAIMSHKLKLQPARSEAISN